MPLSLYFSVAALPYQNPRLRSIANVIALFQEIFQSPFLREMRLFDRLFRSMETWLKAYLPKLREAERATRGIPVLMYWNGALAVTIDRSQYAALRPEPTVGQTFASAGQAFMRGLARVPQAIADERILPNLFGTLAEAARLIAASLTRFAGASPSNPASPRPDMFDSRDRTAGDLFGLAALSLLALTDALDNILQFGVEGYGLYQAYQTAMAGESGEIDLGGSTGNTMPEPAPLTLGQRMTMLTSDMETYTHYIVAALLILPLLPSALRALGQAVVLRIKVTVLQTFSGFEAQVVALRKSVFDFLVNDFFEFIRETFTYLHVLRYLIVLNLHFYLHYLEVAAVELLEAIGTFFQELMRYLEWWRGTVITIINTWNETLDSVVQGLRLGVAYTRLKNDGLLSTLMRDVDPPPMIVAETAPLVIRPFPNLFDTLIAPGLPALRAGLTDFLNRAGNNILGILDAGQTALTRLADRFDEETLRVAGMGELGARIRRAAVSADRVMGQFFDEQLQALNRPGAHSETAEAFVGWLAGGGFETVGRLIPGYVTAMDTWWRSEVQQVINERTEVLSTEYPTSPHILHRNMRLHRVITPRIVLHTNSTVLDDALIAALVDGFHGAVQTAYRSGQARIAAAPLPPAPRRRRRATAGR